MCGVHFTWHQKFYQEIIALFLIMVGWVDYISNVNEVIFHLRKNLADLFTNIKNEELKFPCDVKISDSSKELIKD